MFTYLEALINTNYEGPNTVRPVINVKIYVPKRNSYSIIEEYVFDHIEEGGTWNYYRPEYDFELSQTVCGYDEDERDPYDDFTGYSVCYDDDSDSESEGYDFIGCKQCYYFGDCCCCDND